MRSVCAGCGFAAPVTGGPSHAYIGSSPECWARFGELLARGVGGQLAVDTYAVQHPGVDERRARQSVAVHLISICAQLEHGRSASEGRDLLRRAVADKRHWPWLAQPVPIGTVTVDAVLGRAAPVAAWARDVWRAWSPHHHTVQQWLHGVMAGRGPGVG